MTEYKAWEKHREAANVRRRRVLLLFAFFVMVVIISTIVGSGS